MKNITFSDYYHNLALEEMVQTEISRTDSSREFKGGYYGRRRRDASPGVSQGNFSKVYTPKDSPHEVIKTTKEPYGGDAYGPYIDYVAVNKLFDKNPFVPVVYKVKSVTGAMSKERQERGVIYRTKMEKLISAKEISPEALIAVGNSLFRDFDGGLPDTASADQVHARLAKRMLRVYDMKEESLSHNLNDAIRIIRVIASKIKSWADCDTPNNIMYRLGRGMPQPVILDPLGVRNSRVT